jgi:hypothetical protein
LVSRERIAGGETDSPLLARMISGSLDCRGTSLIG